MCDCKSYNLEVGNTPERIINPRPFFPERLEIKESVCVDECIADQVMKLWKAGIWTLGSCCGHNGLVSRSILVDRSDRDMAREILPKDIQVGAWELTYN